MSINIKMHRRYQPVFCEIFANGNTNLEKKINITFESSLLTEC
jgi:hypothetical protein